MALEVQFGDQLWHFSVTVDPRHQKFALLVNSEPFMNLSFTSSTAAKEIDHISSGSVTVNEKAIFGGRKHWIDIQQFEQKFHEALGD